MEPILGTPTVIIIGGWNKNIINPGWVAKFLIPKEELKVEFPIGQNFEASVQIFNNKIKIYLVSNKLVFQSLDRDYNYIQGIIVKIADYLPHTPVEGFGVNFNFNIEGAISDNLFEFEGNNKITEEGYNITQSTIKRVITSDKISHLNFAMVDNNDFVSFEFNFHEQLKDLTDLKGKILKSGLNDRLSQSISMLNVLGYE